MKNLRRQIVHVLLLVALASSAKADNECSYHSLLQPISYSLELAPNNQGAYGGTAKLITKVSDNTRRVSLHSGVTVHTVSCRTLPDGEPETVEFSPNVEEKELSLSFPKGLKINTQYEIVFTFQGNFTGDIPEESRGFSSDSDRLRVAVFRPGYLKELFPCVDDSAAKASFLLRLARPADAIAISNTPLKSTSQPDSKVNNFVWDTFEKTPEIPPHGFGFVVCENCKLLYETNNIKVWVPKDVDVMLLNVSGLTSNYMQEFVKFVEVEDYPSHLNLIFTNERFDKGYPNSIWSVLIFSAGSTSEHKSLLNFMKESYVYTMGEKMANQWFGNSVTSCDSQLDNALSLYLGYLLGDKVFPEIKMVQRFNKEITQGIGIAALVDDFDPAPYYLKFKGAAVMRMVHHFLNGDNFKLGLKNYLSKNVGRTVNPNDFWASLQEATGSPTIEGTNETLADLMKTWFSNANHPLLTVERNENGVILRQESLHIRPNNEGVMSWIPLSYTTSNERNFESTSPKEWFNPNEETHHLNVILDDDEWLIFNIQDTGFYSVNYDEKTWGLLINQLKKDPKEIHILNRNKLLSDTFILAFSGRLDFSIFLDLYSYLEKETEFLPWETALLLGLDIRLFLKSMSLTSLFDKFVLSIVMEPYNVALADQSQEPLAEYLKLAMTAVACKLGHPVCEQRAVETVREMVEQADYNTTLAYVRWESMQSVLCSAVRTGGAEIWYPLKNYYEKMESGRLRYAIFRSFACTKDRALLERLFGDVLNNATYLRGEGSVGDVIMSIDNQEKLCFFLDFVDKNYAKPTEELGVDMLETTIRQITQYFRLSEECQNKFQAFLKKHSLKAFSQTRGIEKRPGWEKMYSSMESWLKRHY